MDTFMIATVGSLVNQQLSQPAVLRPAVDPFAAAPWCVVHPEDGKYKTFGLQSLSGGSYAVASPFLQGSFDSADKRNLLYFQRPPAARTVLLVDERDELLGGVPLWYRLAADAFDLPPSVAIDQGPLRKQFYRQCEQRPAGPFQRLVIRVRNQVQPDAWLNPAVLRLELDGNEMGPDDPGMQPFADLDNALFVQPLYDPEDDARTLFWSELRADLAARGLAPSVMEALVLGPGGDPGHLEAFQTLDALDGLFLLDTRGCPAGYSWCPPGKAATPNAERYVRYWLRRWSGRCEEAPPPEVFSEALAAEEELGSRATRRARVPADRLADCTASAGALLGYFLTRAEDPSPLGRLVSLLRRPELHGGSADHCHHGHYDLEVHDEGATVELDVIGLLDRFARQYVLPRSRLWVALPSGPVFVEGHPGARRQAAARVRGALAGKYFDLATSLPLCGYEVFRRLTARLDPVARAQRAPVGYRYDWWQRWMDWLFHATPRDAFTLKVPASGLILNRSRLGSARLGWSGTTPPQPRHLRL
jgi:hypothetical protein